MTFLLSVGLPFILDALLIPPDSLDHMRWDVAALLLGSAGIFAAMREAQRVYSANLLPYIKNYALSELDGTHYLAAVETSVLASRVRKYEAEGSASPLQADYSRHLKIAERIHSWSDPASYKKEDVDLPAPLEVDWGVDVSDPELKAVRTTLKGRLEEYGAKYREWTAAKAQVDRNALEEFSLVASPFLLSAAVFVALLNRLNQ